MNKYFKVVLCAALAIAMLLAGCGTAQEPTVAPSEGNETTAPAQTKPEAPKETVKLEMLMSDDTLEGGPMHAMVEKFNEEYKDKGIEVFINEMAYKDIQTQLKNRAQANDLPAMARLTGFDDFLDFILPVDDLANNLSASKIREGKVMAVQANNTVVGLVVNKTAFDAAGVSYPTKEEDRWTWDEFVEAVKKVDEANEKVTVPFVIDHSQQRMKTILSHFGCRYWDTEDPTKIVFRSEDTKRGLEFYLNLFKEGVCLNSIGTGAENAQDTFKTGVAAAHLCGNWVMSDYTENIKDFEWDVALMPTDKVIDTASGGNNFVIFDGSGMEEEAKEFMSWLLKPENYAEYCKIGNYLPGQKGTEVEFKDPRMAVFNTEAAASAGVYDEDGLSETLTFLGENSGNCLRDALDEAISTGKDADFVIDYVVNTYLDSLTGSHE